MDGFVARGWEDVLSPGDLTALLRFFRSGEDDSDVLSELWAGPATLHKERSALVFLHFAAYAGVFFVRGWFPVAFELLFKIYKAAAV